MDENVTGSEFNVTLEYEWTDDTLSTAVAWVVVAMVGGAYGILAGLRQPERHQTTSTVSMAALQPVMVACVVFLVMSIGSSVVPFQSRDSDNVHWAFKAAIFLATLAVSVAIGAWASVLIAVSLAECPVAVCSDVAALPPPAVLSEARLEHLLRKNKAVRAYAASCLSDHLAAKDTARKAMQNAQQYRPLLTDVPDTHLKGVLEEFESLRVSGMVLVWLRLYIVIRRWVRSGGESSGFDNRIHTLLAEAGVLTRGPTSQEKTDMPEGMAEALWAGLRACVENPVLHPIAYELLRALTSLAVPDIRGIVLDGERTGCAVLNLTYSVLLAYIARDQHQQVALPEYAAEPSEDAALTIDGTGSSQLSPAAKERIERAVAVEVLVTGGGAPELGSTLAASVVGKSDRHAWCVAQASFLAATAKKRLAASPMANGRPVTANLPPGQELLTNALLARLRSLEKALEAGATFPQWAEEYTLSPVTEEVVPALLPGSAKAAILTAGFHGSRFVRAGALAGALVYYRGYRPQRRGSRKVSVEPESDTVGRYGWGVEKVLPTGWTVENGLVASPQAAAERRWVRKMSPNPLHTPSAEAPEEADEQEVGHGGDASEPKESKVGVRVGMIARAREGESTDPLFRRWLLIHPPPPRHIPPTTQPAYPALLRAMSHQDLGQFERRECRGEERALSRAKSSRRSMRRSMRSMADKQQRNSTPGGEGLALSLYLAPPSGRVFIGEKPLETGSPVNPFTSLGSAWRYLRKAELPQNVDAVVLRCLPGRYGDDQPAEEEQKKPHPSTRVGFHIPAIPDLAATLIVNFEAGGLVLGSLQCDASGIVIHGPVLCGGVLCIAPDAVDVVVSNYYNIGCAGAQTAVLFTAPPLDLNCVHVQNVAYAGPQDAMLEDAPTFPQALPYIAQTSLSAARHHALDELPDVGLKAPLVILKTPPLVRFARSPTLWRFALAYVPILSLFGTLVLSARMEAGLGGSDATCSVDVLTPPCTNLLVLCGTVVASSVVSGWWTPRTMNRHSHFFVSMYEEDVARETRPKSITPSPNPNGTATDVISIS
eukprot:TRINITY_DN9183_c0_g1_i1.p1 TRINITY_DN9183_c0_g1~~TRINITY_DN9183_c0_g1_i1.p1  ORF type:complete len:1055 (+),score=277.36 TRINITY_DN9183_c0_g1_i1:165-3329(+)